MGIYGFFKINTWWKSAPFCRDENCFSHVIEG